ncbi:MAG: hypothetical protein OEM28_10300 [Nitrosopumilus sp.]|nr:hypothetical protein [Nitrosopumilus sp.]
MRVKILMMLIGLVIGFVFVSLFSITNVFSNEQQTICETMDARWNTDHCVIREESFDFNNLTCDPGTVLEDGTCHSNGIKFVLESFVEPIQNTSNVKVMRSPAYEICMDLALECDYDNSSTSFVGTKKGDEIIMSLHLEGRGQNYTIHLDASAVENMDGSYIKNIEVATDDRPVDYSVNEHGKIDLFSIPLPINKEYNRVDYGKLGHLVVEHDLKSKLVEKNIEYSEGKYIFQEGFTLTSYPPHSSYCAFIESDDGEDYWYEGGFSRDTLTGSKLHDSNPHQCKHNEGSCTCSIVKEQAIENVGILSHFNRTEEEFVGKALQEYLAETKVSNVSNQFVVGKYNFDYDDDVISFCGKFVESNPRNTFEGAIKESKVISFSMRPPMELCAINNDAIIYEFKYLGNEK